MNLLEIKQECGRLLNDPGNQRWSGDVITSRANQIQTEIQALTNAVKTTELLTPTAGSAVVSVDSSVINIVRVRKTMPDGSILPLPGITEDELDYKYPNWSQWDDGDPIFYFFSSSLSRISLVPAPDSVHAITNALSVREIRKPADLSDDADIPFNSNTGMIPFHMTIVHGIVALCWEDDGTPEALAKAIFHRSNNPDRPGQFENQIKIIKSTFDMPTNISTSIMQRPQGGRLGRWGRPSKASPLG